MRIVLDEAKQQTGPPDSGLASSSTDTGPPPSSTRPADGRPLGAVEATSVLIYCHGEPVQAPLIGGGFARCGCGERVRVVW